MKRIKLIFVAALGIMGYVGAHAASGFNQTGTQYHRLSDGTYEQLDMENKGDGEGQWNCVNPIPTETCTYERTTSAPISDANATPSGTGTFVQN